MSLLALFHAVLLAGLLGFGGLGSLPVMRHQLAGAGLPADTLVLHALAVGNISPGPNGLYLVAVGYLVRGPAGAAVAAVAIVIPSLLVLVLEPLRDRLEHLLRFRAALRSLGIAVIAQLSVAAVGLVGTVAHRSGPALLLTAGGVVLLARKVPPLIGVALAIGVGLVAHTMA